jgi:hypothetical protein
MLRERITDNEQSGINLLPHFAPISAHKILSILIKKTAAETLGGISFGNVNHLSKTEILHYSCKCHQQTVSKPSNIKRSSWPFEKQDVPDKKNYIPVPDASRESIEIITLF